MRHQNGNKKLGKPTDQRMALLRSLVTALFKNEKIQTTDDRAKEARKLAEKVITLAKEGTLHSRRQALKVIYEKELLRSIFEKMPERFKERNGGYTRILKIGFRRGDAAKLSQLELVE